MEWSEDFESGLADIDVQHRYIFALTRCINDLSAETPPSTYREIIREVASFAQCHFACEERLMAAYSYPETEKHVNEHAKLLLEIKKYHDADSFEPRLLSLFMCNWIVSHTLMEDRQLAMHVLEIRAEILGMSVHEYARSVFTSYHPSAISALGQSPTTKASGE